MNTLSKAGWKLLRIGTLTALSAVAVQTAQAGPIDPFLVAGNNNIEDTSAERIFRCVDTLGTTSCTLLENGADIGTPAALTALAQAGDPDIDSVYDVFAGVLDFGNVNAQSVHAADAQLTALFAVKVDELLDLDAGAGPICTDCVFDFTGAGESAWNAIFGGTPMSGVALDEGSNSDILAILYQDSPDVFPEAFSEVDGGNWTDAIAGADNGTLAAVLGLLDGSDDFFQGSNSGPFSGTDPDVVGGGTTNETLDILNLRFALSFFQYELSGQYVDDAKNTTTISSASTDSVDADLIGDGNLRTGGAFGTLRCDLDCDNDGFLYANNINADFIRLVPEPATLGLLGISLIGFAGMARRRRA